jgi:hypothetical protein
MTKKQTLTVLAVAGLIYHLAALLKDGEQWMINARQARDNPTLDNLAALVLASGIVVADLGAI